MSSLIANGPDVMPRSRHGRVCIRRARPADARGVAGLFQEGYGNSSHPFRTIEGVSAFLSDVRNFQVVAEEDGRIVSSMAMTYHRWNASYELSRGLTLPDYRRVGLAAELMCRVYEWACRSPAAEVLFAYPRVRRIVDLCSGLEPPLLVVGHDGGLNVANGRRETHLMAITAPIRGRSDHVAPPYTGASSYATLQSNIYERLRLQVHPGPYPRTLFVADEGCATIKSGGFLVGYDAGSANQAMEVLSYHTDPCNPGSIGSALRKCLAHFPEARHVTATVLADKGAIIEELEELGFRMTAYLPAWHKVGRARFDCVQLTRMSDDETANTNDVGDIIAEFDGVAQRYVTTVAAAGWS